METKSISKKTVKESWHIVDAKDIVLGKLATNVASLLRGKHRAEFTPHIAHGDKVVVVNAANVRVTGKKMQNKIYHRHTGYVGNLRSISFEAMMKKHPTRAVEKAVRGMLPHNRLGRALYSNLYVYANNTHPHEAQKPLPAVVR